MSSDNLSLTGFTLIEVIVVMIIIGVLTTMGVPRYLKTAELGRIAQAQAVLEQLRNAEIAYYMQYNAYFHFNYGNYAGLEDALHIQLPSTGNYIYGCYYPANPGVYAQKIRQPYLDGRIGQQLPGGGSGWVFKWFYFSAYGDGSGTGTGYDTPQI